MTAFLKLILKYWKQIIGITIVTLLATIGFRASMGSEQYTGTTFITIGVAEGNTLAQSDSSIYENVEAADHFSESIQGWFKNPSLLKSIEDQTGKKIDINAKKQEKQNIVITYSDTKKANLENTDKIIKDQLEKDIDQYNTSTGTHFRLALYNTTIEESTKSYALYIALGLMMGLFLGFGIMGLYQKVNDELKHIAK